jgi:hypothetical protein
MHYFSLLVHNLNKLKKRILQAYSTFHMGVRLQFSDRTMKQQDDETNYLMRITWYTLCQILLWNVCRKLGLWSLLRQPFLWNGSANASAARQWLGTCHVTTGMFTRNNRTWKAAWSNPLPIDMRWRNEDPSETAVTSRNSRSTVGTCSLRGPSRVYTKRSNGTWSPSVERG